MKKIAIIGASGHGKVCADIARLNGYEEVIFLDDDATLKKCGHYDVKGLVSESKTFADQGYDFFVAIGNADTRKKITERLKSAASKKQIVTLIHPGAVIAEDVVIGNGTVVMAGAVVNPGTVIGNGCIINTSSSVDHDCNIGDFAHVSVGAHIAGTVNIGEKTWIGAGAVVSNNIDICSDSMIGAGTVVVHNIDISGTYVGSPAKKLR